MGWPRKRIRCQTPFVREQIAISRLILLPGNRERSAWNVILKRFSPFLDPFRIERYMIGIVFK